MSDIFDDRFLFASLQSKRPLTTRNVHIRRLYDILQLCLLRDDLPRAKRAWEILSRCKEIHWKTMWATGLRVLGQNTSHFSYDDSRLEYLRVVMRRFPDDREAIIRELLLRLISSNRHREALDELELYLPSFPFQDNPLLHVYAGLLSIYLAQPLFFTGQAHTPANDQFNINMLRIARAHLERAKSLDPENIVATGFLAKIQELLSQPSKSKIGFDHDSDDENIEIEGIGKRSKRLRFDDE